MVDCLVYMVLGDGPWTSESHYQVYIAHNRLVLLSSVYFTFGCISFSLVVCFLLFLHLIVVFSYLLDVCLCFDQSQGVLLLLNLHLLFPAYFFLVTLRYRFRAHSLLKDMYSLPGRHLELYDAGDHGDGEYKQQVVSLIKYVQSKKSSMMWENEDMSLTRTELPSAALLSALVLSVVSAIFFQV